MSIPVELGELAQTLERYPFVYLLTVGEQPRPHICAVPASIVDGVVVVQGAGRGSRERIGANPLVTLLGPPYEAGGHSLIVDGTATVTGDAVVIAPTWAVLHRPAPAGG